MVFSLDEVEVPLDWSQVATDILAQKYFRRAGVPAVSDVSKKTASLRFFRRSEADTAELAALPAAARYGSEHSAVQVFDRLAGAWTYWGWKHHYFDGVDDAHAFFDDLRFMLARQIAAPNSPQWFNTGLHWAYGIDCPSKGHYYVEPESNTVVESTSSYERPQPHACFIQSVSDDLLNDGGIMDLWMRETRLFKYGSGTGSNFSKFRGENEKLSNGGKSSGLLSFLKIGDRAASAIKSGGTTRRAAKMVILEADHPDVEDFIDWKVKEEQKVAALVTGSKIIKKAIKAIMDACVNSDGPGVDCFDPAANPALKKQISLARRVYVPDAIITRVIQLARQGQAEIDFAEFMARLGFGRLIPLSPGKTPNNTIRVTDEFLRAVETDGDWALTARLDGAPVKVMRRETCGTKSAAPPGPAPTLDCSFTLRSTTGTPARPRVRSSRRIRARNICSSTTRRAISPPSWATPHARLHSAKRPPPPRNSCPVASCAPKSMRSRYLPARHPPSNRDRARR